MLAGWSGIPALEPFGVTTREAEGPGWLLLWDALYQGRVLEDDGRFAKARAKLLARISSGDLIPTPTAGVNGCKRDHDPSTTKIVAAPALTIQLTKDDINSLDPIGTA